MEKIQGRSSMERLFQHLSRRERAWKCWRWREVGKRKVYVTWSQRDLLIEWGWVRKSMSKVTASWKLRRVVFESLRMRVEEKQKQMHFRHIMLEMSIISPNGENKWPIGYTLQELKGVFRTRASNVAGMGLGMTLRTWGWGDLLPMLLKILVSDGHPADKNQQLWTKEQKNNYVKALESK